MLNLTFLFETIVAKQKYNSYTYVKIKFVFTPNNFYNGMFKN